jgi:hypothetical protein
MSDQVSTTRRTLDAMNAAANAAIDRNAGPPGGQVNRTRRLLQQMNDAADRAIDDRVARSTPMTPRK